MLKWKRRNRIKGAEGKTVERTAGMREERERRGEMMDALLSFCAP